MSMTTQFSGGNIHHCGETRFLVRKNKVFDELHVKKTSSNPSNFLGEKYSL